jgi:hypothetical protein
LSSFIPKIVYLFGAGATHAEIMNNEKNVSDENFIRKHSLLISHLSERILEKIIKNKRLAESIPFIKKSRKKGNIELLISLIESNNIVGSEKLTNKIKELVQKEINNKINFFSNRKSFYLYKSLLEFHKNIMSREKLLGLITLNYDNILDNAYSEIFGYEPNYCLSSKKLKSIPLLKLHGSFNWKKLKIDDREISIPIMPLGVNKNYLELYYSFVWGNSLELLAKCDILRIIGCSLNQSDWGLLDLLFKANLSRNEPLKLEIIDFDDVGRGIQNRNGFLPYVYSAHEIEYGLIANYSEIDDAEHVGNIFRIWLKAKIDKHLKKHQIEATEFIKFIYDI